MLVEVAFRAIGLELTLELPVAKGSIDINEFVDATSFETSFLGHLDSPCLPNASVEVRPNQELNRPPPCGRRESGSGLSLHALRELRRRLTPPRLGDEHLEICHRHSLQSHKHGWEAVVMRLGKKLRPVSGQQRILLALVRNPHSNYPRVWHARFL